MTDPRRGTAFDELRARIDGRRAARKRSMDRHPSGTARPAPVIALTATDDTCPAHPSEPLYDCVVCAG